MKTRILLVATLLLTLFYLMTGLVYWEGSFDGALVIKPYPMPGVAFGGGESGTWVRHHPGEALPWFMRDDFVVLSRFSWEEGYPAWVGAYEWTFLATLLLWVVVAIRGAVALVRLVARRRTGGAIGIGLVSAAALLVAWSSAAAPPA